MEGPEPLFTVSGRQLGGLWPRAILLQLVRLLFAGVEDLSTCCGAGSRRGTGAGGTQWGGLPQRLDSSPIHGAPRFWGIPGMAVGKVIQSGMDSGCWVLAGHPEPPTQDEHFERGEKQQLAQPGQGAARLQTLQPSSSPLEQRRL